MKLRGATIGSLVKLSVFIVVTLFITAILAFTIANGSVGNTTTYRADFSDATGLLHGDDVRIAGVRVGQVQGIKIVNRKVAEVTLAVEKSVPVHVSANATIRYRNLVGQRYVELDEAPGDTATLPKNGLIPLDHTHPALDLTVLFNGFRPLFQALSPKDVNTFSMEIIQTLQGEGGTVNDLMANTASLTNALADRDALVGSVIDNLNTTLATVDQHNQGLNQLVIQLQRLVTGLASDRQAIAASLGNINDLTVNSASLLKGIRPILPQDLTQLSATAALLADTKNANGQNTMEEILRRLPSKINTIIRTATYGSWFNFYLCDADVLTQAGKTSFHVTNPAAACRTGGA